MDALGRREPENEELSTELLKYLTHSDPLVRRSAVFVLGYRDYRAAFPDIVSRLGDASPDVRACALSWPWWAYVKDHPEVLKQIKAMRSDPDADVRAGARRALAGVSPWYRFWY
jgi:HEAT repeat protein